MHEFAVFREIGCSGVSHLRAPQVGTTLVGVGTLREGSTRSQDWIHVRHALMIEPDFGGIAPARKWAASHLRAAGIDGHVFDVLILLVSEVVTNAIAHAVPPVSLHLTLDDEQARVEVYDCAREVPVVRSPGPSEGGGRGVGLVDQLATDWGTVQLDAHDPLKLVWFELDLAS